MNRRKEMLFKLTQPSVAEKENILRDNLSALRSMVAAEYAAIIIGAADLQKFHHLANKNRTSMSGNDRRLFNLIFILSLRIVWLALERPNIALLGIIFIFFIWKLQDNDRSIELN